MLRRSCLINGWGTYSGSASPAVADISGIVHFKGAISASSGNTNLVAFVLPPAFRPAKNVVVPVDMCNANSANEIFIPVDLCGGNNGRLNIQPNGVVTVELKGSCSGCPSSTITLKAGIENLFKKMMPEEVEEVEALG